MLIAHQPFEYSKKYGLFYLTVVYLLLQLPIPCHLDHLNRLGKNDGDEVSRTHKLTSAFGLPDEFVVVCWQCSLKWNSTRNLKKGEKEKL